MEEKQTEIEDEINLLDYLIVLAKHKGLIIKITLGTAILAAIISLLLPKIYKAETRILPPQQSSSMASQMLSQMAGGLAGMAGGMLGISNPNEMYVGMIQGRTVSDSMISRFNLKERYRSLISKAFNGEVVLEDIREELSDRVDVSADSKSNIITISVEEEDPKIAADMANTFVEELKNLTKGLAVTEAAERRLFFEEQLKDTKTALIKAEEEMRAYQEKTGVLQVDAQAQAVIEGDAELRAQIAAKEVELKVMKTYMTAQNPDMQKNEESLRGMKAQLAKIEAKTGAGADPLMPTGRMPSVGVEYARKLRDVKFNETLYELLVKQFELAKLDEARDAAVIQVIDKAVPPEKKVKPKRGIMVLIGTVAGFLISLFAAFFAEFIESSSKDPETRSRLETFKMYTGFRKKTV